MKTLETVYVRDASTALGFRYSKSRQETYTRKADAIRLTTTHIKREKPDAKGNRYTILQVATASNPELLRRWADGTDGSYSPDGLAFATVREI